VTQVNLRMLRYQQLRSWDVSAGYMGLAVEKRQAPTGEAVLVGRTPLSRSKEGTHPGWLSCVRNTVTPTGSDLHYVDRALPRKQLGGADGPGRWQAVVARVGKDP